MSYGLRIRNRAGSPVLNVTDEITRFRYGTAVSAGVSDYVGLPDISGKKSVEFSVSLEAIHNKVSHKVSRSANLGTVISWSANSDTWYSSAQSLIYLFLYT